MIISIDPGVGGGCALWSNDGVLQETHAWKSPEDMWTHIDTLTLELAVIEKVHPGPNMRAHHAGVMMRNVGHWEGLLVDVEIKNVPPFVWERMFDIRTKNYLTRKRRLLYKAKELYAKAKPTFKTCDAILIGHWYFTKGRDE